MLEITAQVLFRIVGPFAQYCHDICESSALYAGEEFVLQYNGKKWLALAFLADKAELA